MDALKEVKGHHTYILYKVVNSDSVDKKWFITLFKWGMNIVDI